MSERPPAASLRAKPGRRSERGPSGPARQRRERGATTALGRHWFVVAVRTGARQRFAGWPALLVGAVLYLVVVGVVTALWRAAAGVNDGEVAGYTATMLAWYLATTEAGFLSVPVRAIEEIGDDITGGAVATELLRPVSVLGVRIGTELGRGMASLTTMVPTGVVFCLLSAGAPPDAVGLALAAPALVLGVLCNLLLQHLVAALAFWIRDVRSTWFFYQKMIFMLGGMLLPLEVLPPALHRVALGLPFMAISYVPARLASGHVEPGLMLAQLGWVAASAVAAIAAFGAGERRLQVVGG
jgi:ABC-2 type transport system permease protein